MNNQNFISIDEAKFLKTSKKLLSQLNDSINLDTTINSKAFKLSQIQEILSQSLGFRNLNELQKFLSSNLSSTSETHTSIFHSIELEQSVQIISNLMHSSGSGDMWRSRAISLLSSVLQSLIYMRDQKELLLDVDNIREYLILDNIIKLFKTRKDFPPQIRSDLRAYLVSLPGFQESAPKQNDTVMEQHGYLQMQFFNALNKLKNIEKDNFIIADKSWFVDIPKEKLLAASSSSQKEKQAEIHYIFSIHPQLKDFDFLEDSWLDMDQYYDWVFSLHKKNQLKTIRVSDLLIYATTIISPQKRHSIYLILNSILDNYSIASQISKQICNKISSI